MQIYTINKWTVPIHTATFTNSIGDHKKCLPIWVNIPERWLLSIVSDKIIPFNLFVVVEQNITNVRQATQLMDVLFVQNDNGLPLPKWTDEIFPDLFYVMKARNFNFNVETPYMARVKGGLLITDTFEQMVLKRNDKLSHNLAIYSGHDSTLFNVMKPLNVLNQTTFVPEYLAMLSFELHCDTSDDCNVQVKYILIESKGKENSIK